MKLSKTKVIIGLLSVLVVLFLAHILLVATGAQDDEFLSIFRMDYETSLLTWYSQVVLLLVPAVLAFYIGHCKRKVGAKYSKHWTIIGGILVFLSIDDGAMIHEKFSHLSEIIGLQGVLNSISTEWLAWSWWVIYAAVFVVVTGFFVEWFLKLPKRTKLLFVLAVVVMGFGQIGLEAVTGFLNATGNYDIILRGAEKLIGRAGLVILLFSLLDYIQHSPAKERPDIKLEIV